MNDETPSAPEAAISESQTRQRSAIQFPYDDLSSALHLAGAIHSNAGLGDCDDDQLAAWSGQSAKSSGFRVQLASARLFGLIVTEGGRHRLTELGAQAMDPNQVRAAKVQAFFNVPLFKAIFDKYKGGVLPAQSAALEREIVGLGVSDKGKERARQKFDKSAEQAGFFEHGRNRLVTPAIIAPQEQTKTASVVEQSGAGVGNVGEKAVELDLDPLLIELLKKIPKASDGWPATQRTRWFRTFAMNVSQIYDDDKSPIDLEIRDSSEKIGDPKAPISFELK